MFITLRNVSVQSFPNPQIYPSLSIRVIKSHARREEKTHHTSHPSQTTFQASPGCLVLPREHADGASASKPLGPDGFREGRHPGESSMRHRTVHPIAGQQTPQHFSHAPTSPESPPTLRRHRGIAKAGSGICGLSLYFPCISCGLSLNFPEFSECN